MAKNKRVQEKLREKLVQKRMHEIVEQIEELEAKVFALASELESETNPDTILKIKATLFDHMTDLHAFRLAQYEVQDFVYGKTDTPPPTGKVKGPPKTGLN